MNIKNSLIGIFTFAIFIVIILYFVFPDDRKEVLDLNADYLPQGDNEIINISSDEGPNLENSNPNTNQIDLNDDTTLVEEKTTAENNIINAGELSCSDITFFTYQNILEIEESSTRRGYFSDDDVASYKSYAWSALTELGKQGDLLALKLLSKSPSLQDNSKAAKTFFLNAAVYGSTDALNKLAELTRNQVNTSINGGDEEQAIKFTTESLAWYEVMRIRGDYLGSDLLKFRLKISIDELASNNIETDQSKLLPMAQEYGIQFYELLEAERNKRGLTKFDNSIPKAQTEFYALSERFNKDDIWELYSEVEALAVECGFY